MRNQQSDILFQTLISGLEKSVQLTLSQMYANGKRIDEENHRREMEQLKKEIVNEVLSRISATVDVSEIVSQIEELRRAIDSLGK